MQVCEPGSPLHVFITERQSRNEDFIYVQHHAKSIDLIRSSAERGMSRNAMSRIWSYRLLNLVLGHGEIK